MYIPCKAGMHFFCSHPAMKLQTKEMLRKISTCFLRLQIFFLWLGYLTQEYDSICHLWTQETSRHPFSLTIIMGFDLFNLCDTVDTEIRNYRELDLGTCKIN
jgi:hypothetical protein